MELSQFLAHFLIHSKFGIFFFFSYLFALEDVADHLRGRSDDLDVIGRRRTSSCHYHEKITDISDVRYRSQGMIHHNLLEKNQNGKTAVSLRTLK